MINVILPTDMKLTLLFGVLTLLSVSGITTSTDVWDCPPPKDWGRAHHPDQALKMDQAAITVVNHHDHLLRVYGQYGLCWQCPVCALNDGEVKPADNKTFLVNTESTAIFVITLADSQVCSLEEALAEHGRYELLVEREDGGDQNATCHLFLHNAPLDANVPIYVALAIFVGVGAIAFLIDFLCRKNMFQRCRFWVPHDVLINSDLGTPSGVGTAAAGGGTAADSPVDASTEAPPPRKTRLRSLDTFRGFSLMVMAFANMGGGEYWFFEHSTWNGLTVADLVFPWFTFIMGTSIALAFRSLLRRGHRRRDLVLKVIRRTAILFFLGLMISNSGSVELSHLRLPGVLQRLALTYGVVALMEAAFAQPDDIHQHKWWSPVRDILPFWPEWLVTLGLVLIHVCLTFLLPVPGCPTGYLWPGGLHNNASHWNCTGGAAGHIDRTVLGENHIYHHPTSTNVFQDSMPYDPEGILGTFTSVFMCFLGLQAGKILLFYPSWAQRVRRWLAWSIVTGVIAGGLCSFSQNDGVIPVNKNFWSLSFVLALAAMAFFLLTLCYIIIDVLQWWKGQPFIWPGMNSIVVYVCSEVLQHYFPVQWSVPATHAAQLAMHLWGVAVWTTLGGLMYWKGVFVAV